MTQTVITPVRTWRAVPQGSRPVANAPRAVADAPRPADLSADFADHVGSQLDGPVLRYSQRLALIKEAGRRGIGRFEANLVIASVLHARGMGQQYSIPPTPGWAGRVMAVVAVQGAIVAGAWWVWQM